MYLESFPINQTGSFRINKKQNGLRFDKPDLSIRHSENVGCLRELYMYPNQLYFRGSMLSHHRQ